MTRMMKPHLPLNSFKGALAVDKNAEYKLNRQGMDLGLIARCL